MANEHPPTMPPMAEMSDSNPRSSVAPTQPPPVQQQPQPQHQHQHQHQQPYAPYSSAYGQPVQSYAQYTYAQPTPASVHESKAWALTKFGLHVLSIVLCIIGLGVGISLLSSEDGFIGFVATAPLFAFVICWDAAELITRCIRKFKAGIHPGAHVGVSLCIWLAAAIVGGLMSATSASPYYYDDCYYYDECDSGYISGRPKYVVISVAMCLLWAVHFAIFVIACVDIHRRNTARRNAPVMVYQQPPYWSPGQGYAPVQQYHTSQPGQQPMGPPQQAQYAPQQTQYAPQQAQYAPVPTQSHEPNGKAVAVDDGAAARGSVQHEQGHASPHSNHNFAEYYTPGGSAA